MTSTTGRRRDGATVDTVQVDLATYDGVERLYQVRAVTARAVPDTAKVETHRKMAEPGSA